MKDSFSYSSSLIEIILDNTDDGVILFDGLRNEEGDIIDLQYLFLNRSAAQILGKDRDQLIGMSLLQVFPSHENAGLYKAYCKVLETGESFHTEIHYDHDGFDNWFRISAIKMEGKLLVNFNDITGYKEMIAQKTRNENLYRTLIRSLPHADVALIDKDLRPILVEGNPFRALGLEQKVEEGTALAEAITPEALARLQPIFKDCLDGKVRRLEMENFGHLFRMNFQPVRDENGVINRLLMVSEDISIFKVTQNELRNKIYDLESANQGLEQFAYVASHDLQEPLRKIRAFGDRLQTKYREQLDDTARDYIDRMQNASQRMQRLIDDLLKYSRVGRMQEDKEDLDMNQLMDNVLDLLDEKIKEEQVSIKVEKLPKIEAYSDLMEQLFLNLISNAIKFRKEDTPPQIHIWAEAEKDNSAITPQSFIRFYVKDNGIGFEKKYLDRIFDIFQRLHGRNQYPGTGIGLAICRKIVETHGGEIYAESETGKGATFIVKLPQKQESYTYEK